MYCRKCGSELENGARYCGKCGYQTLEWEKMSAQSVPQQPVQTVQPIQQPKKSNGWIVAVVIIVVLAVVLAPIGFILISLYALTNTINYYSTDYDEGYLETASYIYVNNEYVPTLHGYNYESDVCDSKGYQHSTSITFEYCSGEVSRSQLDEYEDYLTDYYAYTKDNDSLYKRTEDGNVYIFITYGDKTTIEYRYYDSNDNDL